MRSSRGLKWYKHDTNQKWNLSNIWHEQKSKTKTRKGDMVVKFYLSWNSFTLALVMSVTNSTCDTKHCQRHYGPRRWLLWPVSLVWCRGERILFFGPNTNTNIIRNQNFDRIRIRIIFIFSEWANTNTNNIRAQIFGRIRIRIIFGFRIVPEYKYE